MVRLSSLLVCLSLAQSAYGQGVDAAATEDLVLASDSVCPSTEAVLAALTKLRPPQEWPEAEIAIHAAEGTLSIEIDSQDTIRRQLSVGPDCDTRATSAALVIATWMDDLPDEETRAPVLHTFVAAPAPVSASRSAYFEVGAGLAAAVAGGWAPGIHTELVRLRGGDTLAWQGSLDVVGPHETSAGQRISRWMRASVAGSVQARHAYDRFYVAADAGLAGAFTAAWGTGYTQDLRDSSFTWGPVVGARAGIPWGRFLLWIDLRGHWWARGDSVRVDSTSAAWIDTVALPSWDAQGSVGLSRVLN